MVDISEFVNSLQANLNEVNKISSLRDPSLRLVDWTVSFEGYIVIGGDERIQRVIRSYRMHQEDKEILEHLYDAPDDDDLSAFGDDDYVFKLVKRG